MMNHSPARHSLISLGVGARRLLFGSAVAVISLTCFLTLAERHRRLLRGRAVTRGGPARGAAGSTAHGAR